MKSFKSFITTKKKTETLKNPDEYNLNRVVHVHHFAIER